MSKRPDMRPYFRARIDAYVNGPVSMSHPYHQPADVALVEGRVTDPIITVTMTDGTIWRWSGGHYARRKVNLCYAPLMPTPIAPLAFTDEDRRALAATAKYGRRERN